MRLVRLSRTTLLPNAAAALTLGLALGLALCAYSLAVSVRWRPIDLRQAERLFLLSPDATFSEFASLQDIWPGELAHYRTTSFRLTSGLETFSVPGYYVSGNYFSTLGVSPALGVIDPNPAGIILSHAAWRVLFDGRLDILGMQVTVNQVPMHVVGVTDRNFVGTTLTRSPMIFISSSDMAAIGGVNPERLNAITWLTPVGRVERVQADVNTLDAELRRLSANSDLSVRGDHFHSLKVADVAFPKQIQGATRAVGEIATIIAAATLVVGTLSAGLWLLVGAEAHSPYRAMTVVLGSAPLHIVLRLLTSHAIVAWGAVLIAGGVAALASHWTSMASDSGAFPLEVRFPSTSGVFTVVVAYAALFCATSTAWVALRLRVVDPAKSYQTIRRTERTLTTVGSASRASILAIQVALAATTLSAAAVFANSAWRQTHIDLGFDPTHVAAIRFPPSVAVQTVAQTQSIQHNFISKIRSKYGAAEVAVASIVPLQDGAFAQIVQPSRGDALQAQYVLVSPEYFAVMRYRLRQGRWLEARDAQDGVVVNEALASRLGGPGAAVGQTIRLGRAEEVAVVVGVVQDSVFSKPTADTGPMFFRGLSDSIVANGWVLVRCQECNSRTSRWLTSLRSELSTTDTPVEVSSLSDNWSKWLALPIALSWVTIVSSLALGALAVVSCWACCAILTMARRREMALRIAIGANPKAVVLSSLKEAIAAVLAGCSTAGFAIWVIWGLMTSAIYGVGPISVGLVIAAITCVGAGCGIAIVVSARASISRIDYRSLAV